MPPQLGRFVRRVGDFLVDAHRFPSLAASLAVLRERGFQPRTCVDVGAYDGEWTRSFRRHFPDCRVLMVEAMDSKTEALRKTCQEALGRIDFEIALLGSTTGTEVVFHEMETGSSVFEESSPYPRHKRQLVTRRLDDILQSARPDFQFPDFPTRHSRNQIG